MSIFNKRIRQATYDIEQDFFDDTVSSAEPNGLYVAFLENEESVEALVKFVGKGLASDPYVPVERFSKPSAFNGFGLGGTFVRFFPTERSIAEIKEFVSKLA